MWGWPTGCSPPSWPPGPRGPDPVVVPPAGTPAFLAPWPVTTLDRPELADLLVRLGIRTLGRVRRAARAATCSPGSASRVPSATGWPGGPRASCPASACSSAGGPARPGPEPADEAGPGGPRPGSPGSGAGTADADGPGRPGPGRRPGPARARGGGHGAGSRVDGARPSGPGSSPGPTAEVAGRSRPAPDGTGESRRAAVAGTGPPTGPGVVLARPLPAQLVDADGQPVVGVTGGGMVTADPDPAVGGRRDRGSR